MYVTARRLVGSAVVILTVLVGACSAAPSWGAVEDAAGERQRVHCRGRSGPAVVFVHGIADKAGSASFRQVIDKLPKDRRVCRYDRPGAGDSPEPKRHRRDAEQLDRELDSVVRRADPDRPVLLVGHSFGSFPVLTYTAHHRHRVAGIVLVDGVDPQLGLLSAVATSSWAAVRMAKEDLNLQAVQDQTSAAVAEAASTFVDLPLVVLRREKNLTPAWLNAQERLAGLSSKGRLFVALGSGHEIPTDNPRAVADAINDTNES
jgi:pimeloyl-ACP methyl ester carboxylesterase